jgi:hypothetical protein
MGFRPPKGVRPPQLEGKRTGRPKGSRSASCLLRHMRAVLRQDETEDRTAAQKAVRQWFRKNPGKFLSQLAALEQAHQAGQEKKVTARKEAVLDLLDELLEKYLRADD